MPNSHEVLRSDISMTTFLSEPDEYQGGELIISTEFGEQKVKLAEKQHSVNQLQVLWHVDMYFVTYIARLYLKYTGRVHVYYLSRDI